MQLSMSDTVTFYKVKKNTTNNNFFYPVIAYYVQRYSYLRYLDDPCALALRESLFIISHLYTHVKRFYKVF